MALASLVSRITGFARQLALAAALGLAVVNDSYTVANTLPNIVYELLLGGVLTSVMVPLLVRAQRDDADGGLEYTRKLLTVAAVVLLVATLIAIACAPLLTYLYLGSGDGHSAANPRLASAFALLLLPQIVFYGLGALFGAILNTRGVFGPFAWAPVLNNVVMLGVIGAYLATPGEIDLTNIRFDDPKLLVLGIGTTLGIVVQTLVLLPSMRKVGVRWRPRLGWDRRLTEAGGLALWVIAYVLIGQLGYIVTTRVAGPNSGSVATYTNAWLLLQVPYGVLGVSLLTALLPRMSRAAAAGNMTGVVSDLSLGSRYSTVALIPVTVLISLFGGSIGVALFSMGRTSEASAARLGATLAVSAFGLLPYALTMLQLRVFYAMKDARTPTLIQMMMVAVKVPLLLLCPMVLSPENVVLGLGVANSFSFLVGALVGQVWLRIRCGTLDTSSSFLTFGKTAVCSSIGGFVAVGLMWYALGGVLDGWPPVARAWVELVGGTAITLLVTLGMMRLVRLGELDPIWQRVRGRAGK
ncbi:murein biosynthesis integral membrane protein MurJ [Pseudonocardia eucalypti]|uniref:Murein biosynthesis integral membrane protein MurJ n=2 Tax=Pseudonocardia eucalypti TaxID=648755 RepID=A0ABP9PDU8_9PSEU